MWGALGGLGTVSMERRPGLAGEWWLGPGFEAIGISPRASGGVWGTLPGHGVGGGG